MQREKKKKKRKREEIETEKIERKERTKSRYLQNTDTEVQDSLQKLLLIARKYTDAFYIRRESICVSLLRILQECASVCARGFVQADYTGLFHSTVGFPGDSPNAATKSKEHLRKSCLLVCRAALSYLRVKNLHVRDLSVWRDIA